MIWFVQTWFHEMLYITYVSIDELSTDSCLYYNRLNEFEDLRYEDVNCDVTFEESP